MDESLVFSGSAEGKFKLVTSLHFNGDTTAKTGI